MADRMRFVFRPTVFGLTVLLLPPLLLVFTPLRGVSSTLIIALGLPVLALLSLVFLAAGIPFLYRKFRSSPDGVEALPSHCEIGEKRIIEMDPPRPSFLPGIRLKACWTFEFGPFHHSLVALLPPAGIGTARMESTRRGEWIGKFALRAADPFGFFHLEFRSTGRKIVVTPPLSRDITRGGVPGRPASDTATATRFREDSDERLERRDYRPGDDTRHLDWKQLARTGDLIVRVGEDGMPVRGRVWILLIAGGRATRPGVCRLDAAVVSLDALARRLSEAGQEISARLPGESTWSDVEANNWKARLAGVLPAADSGDYPSAGERLWILGHPSDTTVMEGAREARGRGCRVSIGYPGPADSPGAKSRLKSILANMTLTNRPLSVFGDILYRRQLAEAERVADSEDFDVRRI